MAEDRPRGNDQKRVDLYIGRKDRKPEDERVRKPEDERVRKPEDERVRKWEDERGLTRRLG